MPIKRRYIVNVHEEAMACSTPKQAEVLEKMVAMDWKVSSVFTRGSSAAICLLSKHTNCWLMPDGKLIRPKHGQDRAELDIKLLT